MESKWFHHISHTKCIFPFCTPLKCGKLSEYTDAHFEVVDPCSRCMNGWDVYDRCGNDTRQFHPSCTACRRTASLPGLAWQNEACSRPHHSNRLAKTNAAVLQMVVCFSRLVAKRHWGVIPPHVHPSKHPFDRSIPHTTCSPRVVLIPSLRAKV